MVLLLSSLVVNWWPSCLIVCVVAVVYFNSWFSAHRGHAGLAAALFLSCSRSPVRVPSLSLSSSSLWVCVFITIKAESGRVQTGTDSGGVHCIATNTASSSYRSCSFCCCYNHRARESTIPLGTAMYNRSATVSTTSTSHYRRTRFVSRKR